MTSRQIQSLLRTGEHYETPSTSLVVRPADRKFSQTACVVGKKVHASSVIRHRYQRLLRAAAQAVIKNHLAYDMVIIAKPAILKIKKLDELKKELEPLFEKLQCKTQNSLAAFP